MKVVYLKIERHVEVKNKEILIKDIGKVYCDNYNLAEKIKNINFYTFNVNYNEKRTVSSMVVIQSIYEHIEEPILISSIGENDFVINYVTEDKEKKAITFLKVLFVMAVTFFGSVFAIMTYNEDVGVSGVFDKIHYIIIGSERNGAGILELTYALGIAVGIIIFFNHFGKKKLTKDPTPMEIEMEKYEADICDTLIKESSRKDETIDIN